MINTKKKINLNIMIYSMVLFSLITDMGGAFGIKNVSFIILAMYLAVVFLTNSKYYIPINFILVEGIVFILMPLVLVLITAFGGGIEIRYVIAEISAYIVWLLYPVLINIEPKAIIDKFKKYVYLCSILVIVTFVGVYLLQLIGRSDLIWRITQFSREYSLGYLGQRPMVGSVFIPNVFYRWTFLLIPGTLLFIKDSNYKLLICIIAVLLTISTGTIVFTFIGILWVLSLRQKVKIKRKKFIPLIITIILIIVLLSLYYADLSVITTFIFGKFNIEDPSTSVKVGHIKSIVEVMSRDVKTFLLGMGLGSSFYSTGTNSMVVNVEVSHFNLIRQFGIIYAVAFFTYILFICYKLSKTDESGIILAIAIICLFLAAGTNPLLISPVFFLPLVIGSSYTTSYKRCIENINVKEDKRRAQ